MSPPHTHCQVELKGWQVGSLEELKVRSSLLQAVLSGSHYSCTRENQVLCEIGGAIIMWKWTAGDTDIIFTNTNKRHYSDLCVCKHSAPSISQHSIAKHTQIHVIILNETNIFSTTKTHYVAHCMSDENTLSWLG